MESSRRKRCRTFLVIVVAVMLVLLWLNDESKTTILIQQYLNHGGESVMLRPLLLAGMIQKGETFNLTTIDEAADAQNSSATPVSHHKEKPIDKANTTSPTTTRSATIVVYLSGEMGNNLSVLAKAFTIQLEALQLFNISTTLVLRHQLHGKWIRARDNIQQCFPHFRRLNFSYANTNAFDQVVIQQESILPQHYYDPERLRLMSATDNMHTVHQALDYWKQILDSSIRLNDTINTTESLWFPFLSVGSPWCPLDLIDKHLDSIRNVFHFDTDACCKALPFSNETVFHLRNFLIEMPNRGKRLGFEELSPNKTAQELLGHLQTGDPVALVSRFQNAQPYVLALRREHGLQVRLVGNQSDVQDFCFLLKTSKELIGTWKSTYVTWAAYLGNATRVNLYRVVSPNTDHTTISPQFNWTHPLIKDRIVSIAYASEEQDALNAKIPNATNQLS